MYTIDLSIFLLYTYDRKKLYNYLVSLGNSNLICQSTIKIYIVSDKHTKKLVHGTYTVK